MPAQFQNRQRRQANLRHSRATEALGRELPDNNGADERVSVQTGD